MTGPVRKTGKYPGRTRVLSREAARDYLYRQQIAFLQPRYPCTRPVELPAVGLPSAIQAIQGQERQSLTLTMQARCRKCEGCLKHRRNLWAARALDEVQGSTRTWFGTLTIRPSERVRLRYRAEARYLRAGRETISSLDASEQFRIVCRELYREATLFLKRLRQQCGPFRYLLVVEAHKSGDPHLHMLIHEHEHQLPKATIEAQWRIGFSHWRLVEETNGKAVWYVCKYLAKDAAARVRASQRYGQPETKVRLVTEKIEKICDALSE